MTVKVENMTSANGNKVANQFIIRADGNEYFQSYDSLIAVRMADGKTILDENLWNYSNTTGKYRNYFLGENIAETRAKIEAGVYILENLN